MLRWKMLFSMALSLGLVIPFASAAQAETVTATVFFATDSGNGEKIGTVTFTDEAEILAIATDLAGLPVGEHGFHVHEKPDCSPVEKDGKMGHAMAAGGHFDPDKTGKHLGPEGGGHKGDLPFLTVQEDGTAKITMHVKGAKAADFKNRALMIHAGGDNYSDIPAPLGGGGARIGCGIIE